MQVSEETSVKLHTINVSTTKYSLAVSVAKYFMLKQTFLAVSRCGAYCKQLSLLDTV